MSCYVDFPSLGIIFGDECNLANRFRQRQDDLPISRCFPGSPLNLHSTLVSPRHQLHHPTSSSPKIGQVESGPQETGLALVARMAMMATDHVSQLFLMIYDISSKKTYPINLDMEARIGQIQFEDHFPDLILGV